MAPPPARLLQDSHTLAGAAVVLSLLIWAFAWLSPGGNGRIGFGLGLAVRW